MSVVIPSYNRDVSLMSRSINSVLKQTYRNIEIIVVDDNPNNSQFSSRIKEYCDKIENVIYVKQDGNKGACEARNLGIKYAKGEWIGFLDDDDEWLPEKIEKSIPYFSDNIGIVATPGYILYEDETHNIVKRESYNYNPDKKKIITHSDFLKKDLIGSTSQAIVRKQCFVDCGGFDKQLPARQDYEMWIRISKKYDTYYVNEPLFNHYMHIGEQISTNPHKSVVGFKTILKKYKNEYQDNVEALIQMNIRVYKSARQAREYFNMFTAMVTCARHPFALINYITSKRR